MCARIRVKAWHEHAINPRQKTEQKAQADACSAAALFIILFGIGMSSKGALVAITVFFLLLNSTIDGIHDVDRDLVQSLRLMGATRMEVLRKVLLPSALLMD